MKVRLLKHWTAVSEGYYAVMPAGLTGSIVSTVQDDGGVVFVRVLWDFAYISEGLGPGQVMGGYERDAPVPLEDLTFVSAEIPTTYR